MNIEDIDKNFKIESNVDVTNYDLFDIRKNANFEILGLYKPCETTKFMRIPDEIAKKTNDGVQILNYNVAGGRVRFSTNSEYIILKAIMPIHVPMPHITAVAQEGFDLYEKIGVKHFYRHSFCPPLTSESGYELIHHFGSTQKRDLIINFPLYNNVDDVFIGIEENAELEKCSEYTHEKPILYYGSSITQGGCASRPGNAYQAMISRKFDANFINLGFSGSAKGEEVICEYLSTLDCSIFVCDYDHNAPSSEHLLATHKKFYEIYRKKNPTKPIILVSKPDFNFSEEDSKRLKIIKSTYEFGILNGDCNLYFVDGSKMFDGEFRDSCTVDGCHPNDLGFLKMALCIGDAIGKILKV